MAKTKNTLVGPPVKQPHHLPQFEVICSECGGSCWISEDGKKRLEMTADLAPICTNCLTNGEETIVLVPSIKALMEQHNLSREQAELARNRIADRIRANSKLRVLLGEDE